MSGVFGIETIDVLVVGFVFIGNTIFWSNGHFGAFLLFIGLSTFAFSLILMSFFTYFSIPAEEGEKRIKSLIKLDRKEIRRSIAISFTILYISMISFYFQEAETVAKSLVEASKTAPMNTTLAAQGLTHLSSVITAFTTVYVLIIGFYFGSRVYEKIQEIKNAEEALKIQYIMGEIGSDVFKKKMGVLKGTSPNSQLEQKSDEKKITIEHKGGIDIIQKDNK